MHEANRAAAALTGLFILASAGQTPHLETKEGKERKREGGYSKYYSTLFVACERSAECLGREGVLAMTALLWQKCGR